MVGKILIPLDGSPIAERAIGPAGRLARETSAELVLVRCTLFLASEATVAEHEQVELQEAADYLDAQARELTRQGFAVSTELLPCDAVRGILFAAETHDVDLISLSTHGRAGLEHAVLGSVAEAVLRRSRVPVLLTRAVDSPAPTTTDPFRRILIPLDGTPFAESALTYLIGQRLGRTAQLILHRAVAPTVPPYPRALLGDAALDAYRDADRQTEEHRMEAQSYLAAVARTQLAGYTCTTRATVGLRSREILSVAEDEEVDLIVLATHARHGLDRLLHGSTSHALLHGARVPVLILHGSDAQAARAAEEHAAHEAHTALAGIN